ncbi:hypothetical protein HYU96_02765, partial [Candidatus Daviesbacteria bacterium]|nr:hypothetical protein [Candidatus Daviesbacteria bacterium]
SGSAYFDTLQDDVVINIKKGKLHPKDLKKITEMVSLANKKLFIPHEYEWILDREVKLTKVLPVATPLPQPGMPTQPIPGMGMGIGTGKKSAVKVFSDQPLEDCDGVYIASEKIFDLNKPRDSLEDLILRIQEILWRI